MELRGDEKRIQALFCELSLEDQTIAPRFKQLWNSAQPAKASSARLAFVIVSVLLIAALWLLAVSNHKSVESAPSVARINETPTTSALYFERKQAKPPKRIKRPRKIEHAMAQEAALLSSWQSPTEIFMSSPTAFVMNSLPQLDKSVNELKQFLPKESNQ